MSRQSRFNAQYWMLGASALGWPRGMVWGGRREEGSGWRTHVYLWRIHFDIRQNQYNIVKLKNKIKLKKKKKEASWTCKNKLLLITDQTLEPSVWTWYCKWKWKWSHSVVSNSVRPHRRQPTRLPCPWDSPGKNTGVGCHFLIQCMKVKSEVKSEKWSRSVVLDS